MTEDHYRGAARGWAAGATLVYGPLATALVRRAPHSLSGRCVLDVGAGTGAASSALRAAGARPIAVDLSHHMLRWQHHARPPAAVGDITRLPLRTNSIDDTVAAFVLNHLPNPADGLAELARVTRPGGAVVASVFATSNRSHARDLVDQVAVARGFVFPDWYLQTKATTVPQLGTAARMAREAKAAGLANVDVGECALATRVTTPAQLVDYRFGQAHYAAWVASLAPAELHRIRLEAIDAATPVMTPYQPVVVSLAARSPELS